MSIKRTCSLAVAAFVLLVSGASGQDVLPPEENYQAPKREYSPYAGDQFPNQVYFGDTHLHSSWSTDSGMAGGTLGPLAARSIGATLSRTAVAVASLMVAISATIGVGIMVDSFRETVAHWLGSTLRADVYASPPSPVSTRSLAVLDPELIARLAVTPGVAQMGTGRHLDVESERGTTRLNVLGMVPAGRQGFRLLEGQPSAA